MQGFFRCVEEHTAECNKILKMKGVKAVTDMIYEARAAAVVKIEAAKKIACPRRLAHGKFPHADEYMTVNALVHA